MGKLVVKKRWVSNRASGVCRRMEFRLNIVTQNSLIQTHSIGYERSLNTRS